MFLIKLLEICLLLFVMKYYERDLWGFLPTFKYLIFPKVLLELPYAPSLMMIKAFCMRLIHKGAPNSAHVVLVELLKPEKASSSQDEHFGTFLIKELIYADTVIIYNYLKAVQILNLI